MYTPSSPTVVPIIVSVLPSALTVTLGPVTLAPALLQDWVGAGSPEATQLMVTVVPTMAVREDSVADTVGATAGGEGGGCVITDKN